MLSAVGLGVHKLSPARFRFNPSPRPRRTSAVDIATPSQNSEPVAMDVDMMDAPVGGKKEIKEKKTKKSAKEVKNVEADAQPVTVDIPMVDAVVEAPADGDANDAKQKKRKSSKKSQKNQKSTSQSENKAPEPTAPKDTPIQPEPESQKPKPPPAEKKTKLPKLPEDAKVTKRAIHHPPIPTPFSSAQEPKVVYITASSPFIPQIKRIRSLLAETSKRSKQSLASKPGKLSSKNVDKAIADAAKAKGGVKKNEEVFVKATGKAIERALEIGLFFQQQADCRVRVSTGSVEVVDDVEVKSGRKKKMRKSLGGVAVGDEEKQVVQEDVEMDVDVPEKEVLVDGKRKRVQDVPETRVRTVSSVEVAISLV